MGELKGTQLQPREIARLCWEAGWQDAETLLVAVCVALSESQGFTRAHNINSNGSEDFGIFQINVAKDDITDALKEKLYDPKENVDRAMALYLRRGFEPWYGYTKGVYLHDSYIGRALVGVANFLGERILAVPVPDWGGEPYVHKFTTPMVDHHFRVQILADAVIQARSRFRGVRWLDWADRMTMALARAKLIRP